MTNAVNTHANANARGLSAVYRRLYLLGVKAELAQLDGDETRRTCLRCGGDAYQEGDVWRCWNCDNTGSAE